MAKINVSLPDELLEEIDALAQELERSRSGLVKEATEQYVTTVKHAKAQADRRESIARARRSARELSGEVAAPDLTEAIRSDRDRDGRKAGAK